MHNKAEWKYMKEKQDKHGQTPPRVAPRLEGVVKNVGIKPKKKVKRERNKK